MKKFLLIFLFQSALVYPSTSDSDFENLSQCINQKFSQLRDRNAIVAAVVTKDKEKVLLFNNAQLNQLFEIGSITKTFTALLTAMAVADGKVSLEESIPGQFQKPGSVITYKHLTTHTSGLIQGRFLGHCPNPQFPYEGLSQKLFDQFYQQTPLAYQPGTGWKYSNIGTSLQGRLVAEAFQGDYAALVQSKILDVLEMNDTFFEVPLEQRYRFPQGRVNGAPWAYWDLFDNALNPAGGLRSTITDMIKYARANLSPDDTRLGQFIQMTHQPLYHIKNSQWIGMNWLILSDVDVLGHSGSTIGFESVLLFSKKRNLALVAMIDSAVFNGESLNLCEDFNYELLDDSFQQIVHDCFLN